MGGLSIAFGITFEELYQAAFSSVVKALLSYDPSKQVEFYPYWKGTAVKSMFNYVHQNSYMDGARGFVGSFSLDERMENGSSFTYSDVIGFDDQAIGRELIINENRTIIKDFYKTLSDTNKRIFVLLLRDFDRDEMAIALNLKKTDVYNRIATLRKKFSEFLNKDK